MGRTPPPLELRLNPAEQRALAAFFAGRLPAGQVHAELCRASTVEAPVPPLPDDTASIPVPARTSRRRLSRALRAA
jgi:hypothetical protein